METARKNSKKRTAILNVLRGTVAHPSAEMVYTALKAEIPELSLGTVYRNLALLSHEGQIISVGTVAGQERYDARTAPHAHFVCTRCHRVDDLDIPDTVSGLLGDVEKENGCIAESFSLTVTGLCAHCRACETPAM